MDLIGIEKVDNAGNLLFLGRVRLEYVPRDRVAIWDNVGNYTPIGGRLPNAQRNWRWRWETLQSYLDRGCNFYIDLFEASGDRTSSVAHLHGFPEPAITFVTEAASSRGTLFYAPNAAFRGDIIWRRIIVARSVPIPQEDLEWSEF